jgi:hypothetical protein
MNPQKYENAGGHTYGKPSNVNERITLLSFKMPKGNFYVVFYHFILNNMMFVCDLYLQKICQYFLLGFFKLIKHIMSALEQFMSVYEQENIPRINLVDTNRPGPVAL